MKREAVVSAVVSDRLVVDSAADADGTEEIEGVNEEEEGRRGVDWGSRTAGCRNKKSGGDR